MNVTLDASHGGSKTSCHVFPDIDVQSISSYTDSDGDDSDSDFYIVPLPDCFNPELPCSTSTSTSVVIKKGTLYHRDLCLGKNAWF